ncbi:PIN domain containing protein [Novymonas esmeraldas]|uniref:PIN domain containing protein n=1 Tax=Novymonas esmeraldas TaxID=1808958 RepID=A0AAW0EP72_9TRYP
MAATAPIADVPCCVVLDSSALLHAERNMYQLLKVQLPRSPHVFVIPKDVLIELQGLTKSGKGTVSGRAEDLLQLFQKCPQFQRQDEPPAAGTTGATAKVRRLRGVVVQQKPKETYYPLERFARNRDTRIVACAHYFTIDPATSAAEDTESPTSSLSDSLDGIPSPDSPASSPFATRCFGCTKGFFVTDDLVQQLKASAYNIPTIDSATLKNRFGHLGRDVA